jgi:hypothetical protein
MKGAKMSDPQNRSAEEMIDDHYHDLLDEITEVYGDDLIELSIKFITADGKMIKRSWQLQQSITSRNEDKPHKNRYEEEHV